MPTQTEPVNRTLMTDCAFNFMCLQTTVCSGHHSWIAALQDTGSVLSRSLHTERHRSWRILHTQRNCGELT